MTTMEIETRKPSDDLAENVRSLLAVRQIQQATIAEYLGLKRVAVSDRYRGRTPWTVNELVALSKFLDVTVEELLCTRRDSNPKPSDP